MTCPWCCIIACLGKVSFEFQETILCYIEITVSTGLNESGLFVCSWFLFLLDKKNVKYLIYGEKKKKGVENIFQEEIKMEGNL